MGNRYYPIGDKELASVTTITGLVDKSEPLIIWAINCLIAYFIARFRVAFKIALDKIRMGSLSRALIWLFWETLRILNDARTEWRTVRDEAGDIGTQVHDALEAWLKDLAGSPPGDYAPLDKQAQDLYYAATAKLLELGPFTVLATEQKVVNEDEWYAGRYDAKILIHATGKKRRIDFKTYKGTPYKEWGMQIVAYDKADDEECDELMILGLNKENLRAKWHDYTEERALYWRAFLGLRDAFYILKAKKKAREAWLTKQ